MTRKAKPRKPRPVSLSYAFDPLMFDDEGGVTFDLQGSHELARDLEARRRVGCERLRGMTDTKEDR